MDVEEAHKLLGLYTGASPEQIEAKFSELSTRLSTDEKAELRRLETARAAALGEAAPGPKPGPRGWKVLLFMAVTMVLIAGSSFIGVAVIDARRQAEEAAARHDEARAVLNAWQRYREATGVSGNDAGERATAAFQEADRRREAGDHEEAAADYVASVEAFTEAFRAEDARVTRSWQTEVLAFWRDRLKGRFPFDSESDTEAAADDVARLFNPASGAIWAVERDYRALAEVEIQSRRVATPLEDLEAILVQAGQIRAALFGDHSATIDVRFELRLTSQRVLHLYRLRVGDAEARSRDDDFARMHWRQADGGAALVRGVDNSERREVIVDLSDSDWGLLRILSKGHYTGAENDVHTWQFDPDQFGGRRGQGAAILIRPGERNPFDLSIYSSFNPG
jgi:hypothetical protein